MHIVPVGTVFTVEHKLSSEPLAACQMDTEDDLENLVLRVQQVAQATLASYAREKIELKRRSEAN